MKFSDVRAITLSVGMLTNTVCLVYFMPGLWGLLVCLFLLVCAAVVVSEK